MKKKVIIITITTIALIAVLCLLVICLSFNNSPRYTMYRLIVAEKENNPELACEYFDFDKIADNHIGRVTEAMMEQLEDNPFATMGLSLIQNMKPGLVAKMKKELTAGNASDELKAKSKFEIYYICLTGNFDKVEDKYKKISKNKFEMTTCPKNNKENCTPARILEKTNNKWVVTDIKVDIPKN